MWRMDYVSVRFDRNFGTRKVRNSGTENAGTENFVYCYNVFGLKRIGAAVRERPVTRFNALDS